jgi:hypothetical protein
VVPDLPVHWRADAAAVSKHPRLVEAASLGLPAEQEKGVGLPSPRVFITFLAAAAEPGSSFSTLGFLSFLIFVELTP